MIKISGCCDGCGKEADCTNINEFARCMPLTRASLSSSTFARTASTRFATCRAALSTLCVN